MVAKKEQLIIQQFFVGVERELGYKPDIEKYFDFIKILMSEQLPDNLEARQKQLYGFARFLFCERERDEPRFEQIFNAIFEQERLSLDGKLEIKTEQDAPAEDDANLSETEKKDSSPSTEQAQEDDDVDEFYDETEEEEIEKPWEEDVQEQYINFNTSPFHNSESHKTDDKFYDSDYVYSDDYHVINFRQMIQSWRYFRLEQPMGFSDKPDVEAMVHQLAKDGLFTKMQYKPAFVNRPDSLLIFADRRGSMTPFHGLVDSLIRTATMEGGHHKARVFYYQNYPLDFVYKNPYLTIPQNVDAVLSKVSALHTYVLIISDAGAAKGHLNMGRVNSTGFISDKDGNFELDQSSFLGKLLRLTKDVVWLNPMPRNRWKGTSAEVISKMPAIKMFSLYDSNRLGFTFAIKDLLYEG